MENENKKMKMFHTELRKFFDCSCWNYNFIIIKMLKYFVVLQ